MNPEAEVCVPRMRFYNAFSDAYLNSAGRLARKGYRASADVLGDALCGCVLWLSRSYLEVAGAFASPDRRSA